MLRRLAHAETYLHTLLKTDIISNRGFLVLRPVRVGGNLSSLRRDVEIRPPVQTLFVRPGTFFHDTIALP